MFTNPTTTASPEENQESNIFYLFDCNNSFMNMGIIIVIFLLLLLIFKLIRSNESQMLELTTTPF